MSCQIKPFAKFVDLDSVRRRLFPAEDDFEHQTDSWEWPEEDVNDNSVTYNLKDNFLTQNCMMSLSSMGDTMVIAHKNVMVVLTSKWDSQESGDIKTKFHISWYGNPGCLPDEEITSVLCIPLVSLGKSSHFGPDWTCIVVGFSSGFIRFYTESVNLLVEDLLHDEPVRYLKCQSYLPPRFSNDQEQTEELYATYLTAVCIIPGFGLFQTLRACRNQLARVKANCGDVLRAPPLVYKKWGFQEQSFVNDCEVMGPSTSNTFDHLMTASLKGGFSAGYRSSAPQMSLVVASGKMPYVGFHYALEGASMPMLTDVAKAVAHKLKSAIGQAVPFSGWWSGNKKANESEKVKEKAPTEPVEPMVCRFGLCDVLRHGDQIVASPNRSLSVVTDNFGRIIVIDNQKGVAIRMWKGYREAQCSWLEVEDENRKKGSSHTPRMALFLIIYSPRKSLIEIWAMQQGPRVASFAVCRNGRLLHTGYGLMGLNNMPLRGGNKSQFPSVFIDSKGQLNELIVPFHFALSDKNSKRARDLHLLRKLKTFLKTGEFDNNQLTNEVMKTLQDLKTNEVRCQALEVLASSKYSTPEAFEIALDVCKRQLDSQDPEALDHAGKVLLYLIKQLRKLVTFYQFVYQQYQKPPNYNTVVNVDKRSPEVLSELLNAPEREITSLLNLTKTIENINDMNYSQTEIRVAFVEDGKSLFVDFLSSFDVSSLPSASTTEYQPITLKKDLSEEKIKRISELLYQGVLYSNSNVETWREEAGQSHIKSSHLMHLALQFWLQKREGAALIAEMLRFCDILKAICALTDFEDICASNNELSPWWNDIRTLLSESTNPFMALTGAILCRSAASAIDECKKGKAVSTGFQAGDAEGPQDMSVTPDEETKSPLSEWENVSRDTCQWTLIISQLEDVALLNTVLMQKPRKMEVAGITTTGEGLCCLPYTKPSISLNYVLTKGKGSVSELVARWLSSAGLVPQQLVDMSDMEFDAIEKKEIIPDLEDNKSKRERLASFGVTEGESITVDESAEVSNDNSMRILELLGILKCHFPYSLSSSLLLSNLCWEYMLSWSRSVDELTALEAAVSCLEAIPSAQMRHGVCSLIWAMHLRQRFEATAKLFQKTGKVPKERLCWHDVGLSDIQMPSFLLVCTKFLDIFMDACHASGMSRVKIIPKYEDLWNGEVHGPPPLAELALGQPAINFNLVHLHFQLALALHMMSAFSLRVPKPISTLFNSVGQAALFSDLTSNPQLPSHKPYPALLTARTQFLMRVTSAAMQLINKDDSKHENGEVDSSAAIRWMGQCHDLASVWGVSSDDLRRHQVCELYSLGYDRIAEEVLRAVSDTKSLASQLLLIVGVRIRHLMFNSLNYRELIVRFSPYFTNWIESLETNNICECSLSDTQQLLALVIQYLPEEHEATSLTSDMVDALHFLMDNQSS